MKMFARLLAAALTFYSLGPARADFLFTVGSGQTAVSFTSSTGGTALCAAANTHCFASVPINSAGAPIGISGTPFFVTGAGGTFPVSGTLAATQSGTWTVQPGNTANTTAWLVTGTGGTFPVTATNLSTNISQINGVTPLMGAGNTGTGSPRVTLSTDQAALAAWGFGATGSAVPAGASYGMLNVGGTGRGITGAALGSTFSQHIAVVDGSGNQVTSFGGSSAAVGAIGSAVPSSADYGGINVAGNLRGATGAALGSTFSQHIAVVDGSGNQVTSFGGSNASVGTLAAAAPTSGTYVGFLSGSNLVGVSAANPMPVVGLGDAKAVAYSAQTGSTIMGLVNTSIPTGGTDNTLDFVSLTTSRELRVSASANASTNITQIGGNAILTGNGATGTGSPRVTIASDNTPFAVNPAAAATGGATPYKLLSGASTNAASIKGSAGTLYELTAINVTSASWAYLKLYNVSGTPTCNSDTVVGSYPIPPNTLGTGYTIPLGSIGKAFTTGIGICITGGIADNDNTSITANAVALNAGYK